MKKKGFVGLILLVLSILVLVQFLPNLNAAKQNQDTPYQVNFPVLGEHAPEILNIEFSSDINFDQIAKPLPIIEVSQEMYSDTALKALGEGFGFSLNELKKNDYSYDWYVKPGHYLTVMSEGTFIYQNSPETIDPAEPFPDDSTLQAAAEKFLKDNNLLSEGFVFSNVADGLVAEFGSGERYVEQRTVSFMRYIDNVPVYGNSRLTVSFDRELNIVGVDSVHSPIKAVADSPQVKNAKDMLETAIEKGRGLRAFDLHTPSIGKVSILISEIRQAYWEDNDSNLVVPVFHYTGDLYNEEGEHIGKFVGIEQSF